MRGKEEGLMQLMCGWRGGMEVGVEGGKVGRRGWGNGGGTDRGGYREN